MFVSAFCFAQPFSMAKYNSIDNHSEKRKYAYESQISKQTNFYHVFQSYYYCIVELNKNFTVQQIISYSKKFENNVDKKILADIIGQVAGDLGYQQFAFKQFQICKSEYIFNRLASFYVKNKNTAKLQQLLDNNKVSAFVKVRICKQLKNYDKLWKFSEQLLLTIPGCNDTNRCQTIIQDMFKYRPKSIKKEQQIVFLEQIAQMYPIPGTDFNQWKGFMGFVGFKYKALTGKDLF